MGNSWGNFNDFGHYVKPDRHNFEYLNSGKVKKPINDLYSDKGIVLTCVHCNTAFKSGNMKDGHCPFCHKKFKKVSSQSIEA